jgi:hypothetical protein
MNPLVNLLVNPLVNLPPMVNLPSGLPARNPLIRRDLPQILVNLVNLPLLFLLKNRKRTQKEGDHHP